VQYSYDDRSVVLVNDTPAAAKGLTVTATVLDFDLARAFTRSAVVDSPPDSARRVFEIPILPGLTTTYFVRLAVTDSNGRAVSRNFYWLSTNDDRLDWPKTEWYYTPTTRHADLTALARLPATTLSVSQRETSDGPDPAERVIVSNAGRALAFQVHLALIDPASGIEILPAFWADNYFELLPGEQREIRVSWPRDRRVTRPRVTAEAWNAALAR
jgi:exo-1,4-beta-D-glucosaminidase